MTIYDAGDNASSARNDVPSKPLVPMHYYDLQKNWTKRIEPHLGNKQLNNILVRDLNKLSSSRWGKPFIHGQYPWEYGDLQWTHGHKGPAPRYWRYTQAGSCHWLVNFNLKLATLVEPQQHWRIVTSPEHSTVWDGRKHCSSSIFWPSEYRPRNALISRLRMELCWRLGNSDVPIQSPTSPPK